MKKPEPHIGANGGLFEYVPLDEIKNSYEGGFRAEIPVKDALRKLDEKIYDRVFQQVEQPSKDGRSGGTIDFVSTELLAELIANGKLTPKPVLGEHSEKIIEKGAAASNWLER